MSSLLTSRTSSHRFLFVLLHPPFSLFLVSHIRTGSAAPMRRAKAQEGVPFRLFISSSHSLFSPPPSLPPLSLSIRRFFISMALGKSTTSTIHSPRPPHPYSPFSAHVIPCPSLPIFIFGRTVTMRLRFYFGLVVYFVISPPPLPFCIVPSVPLSLRPLFSFSLPR